MQKKHKGNQIKANAGSFSRRFLFLFFITVWSTLTLFSSGVVDSQDGWLYVSVSKNIYYNHRIESIPNYYPKDNVHMNTSQGADGVWRAPGSVGYSFAMVPAVALSDLMHRLEGSKPSVFFPLEHDRPLHFFISMTNTFWGSLLALILLLYIHELTQSKKIALFGALIALFATNLLPYTKFSFPHILFTFFVVCSFYLLRRFAVTKQLRILFMFCVSYCGVAYAYNVAYYIPILPLILYYFLLLPRSERISKLRLLVLLSIPFVIWKFKTLMSFLEYRHVYPKLVFEGVWGFLFSPGKSVFLYSPPLIIPLLFWHKIQKKYLPEVLSWGLLSLMYLYLLGVAFIPGSTGEKVPIWHGGMSWGPRYVTTLIPFGMILAATMYSSLSSFQRRYILTPILLAGLWVQLIGTSLPYLLQYQNTSPQSLYVGKQELSVYDYGSFIPRFSPIYVMSRELLTKIRSFPKSIDHGENNVRFYDGFEVPLFTGLGPYRGFRSQGHILFDSPINSPAKTLRLSFYNALDYPESSSAANIRVVVNGEEIGTATVPPSGNADLHLDLSTSSLSVKNNTLDLTADYPATSSAMQVVYISQMKMNENTVNVETLDYPEVSTVGDKNSELKYQYFGKNMNDRWKLWYLRARISERTFDFWWVKNLYYWDRPRNFYWALFALNCTFAAGSWIYLIKSIREMKDTK